MGDKSDNKFIASHQKRQLSENLVNQIFVPISAFNTIAIVKLPRQINKTF